VVTEGRYLHSPDPRIRRWSAVAYSVASATAGIAWAASGSVNDLTAGRYLAAVTRVFPALLVWFVLAGIGLRVVRRRERHLAATRRPIDG
jgi:hypothetical protein